MAYQEQVKATWGTALATLRDNVSSLANWSVKHDSSGGAAELASGDHFVLSTSAPQEDIYVGVNGQLQGVVLQHGPNYDSANTTWSDRYTYDPAETDKLYDPADDQEVNSEMTAYPKQLGQDIDPLAMNANGSYWMGYADGKGFWFYWQREEGDGYDREAFIGTARINRAWDYLNAQSREAGWCLGYGDSNKGSQQLVHMSASGKDTQDGKEYVQANNTLRGRGVVNPDNEFDNFPSTNNVVASDQYTTANLETAIIGEHKLWLDDLSGAETGHKDLVQDGGGNDIYVILKRGDTPHVAFRNDL